MGNLFPDAAPGVEFRFAVAQAEMLCVFSECIAACKMQTHIYICNTFIL